MTQKFEEYRKTKRQKESYKKASEIQEAFALTSASPCGAGISVSQDQGRGHLAVSDVLNKIDAMARMFESGAMDKNGDFEASAEKIISIVEDLYDLAQIKLAEAKKQAGEYMRKASGVSSQVVPAEVVPDETPAEEPAPEEPEDSGTTSFSFSKKPLTGDLGGEPASVEPEESGMGDFNTS